MPRTEDFKSLSGKPLQKWNRINAQSVAMHAQMAGLQDSTDRVRKDRADLEYQKSRLTAPSKHDPKHLDYLEQCLELLDSDLRRLNEQRLELMASLKQIIKLKTSVETFLRENFWLLPGELPPAPVLDSRPVYEPGRQPPPSYR